MMQSKQRYPLQLEWRQGKLTYVAEIFGNNHSHGFRRRFLLARGGRKAPAGAVLRWRLPLGLYEIAEMDRIRYLLVSPPHAVEIDKDRAALIAVQIEGENHD